LESQTNFDDLRADKFLRTITLKSLGLDDQRFFLASLVICSQHHAGFSTELSTSIELLLVSPRPACKELF
jgi:hypothetical protein